MIASFIAEPIDWTPCEFEHVCECNGNGYHLANTDHKVVFGVIRPTRTLEIRAMVGSELYSKLKGKLPCILT